MNDNLPTNVQLNANDNGSVIFATDVISTIAGLAATEVEGVTNMVGASSGGFSEIFSRKNQSSKSLTKGVKVELSEGNKVTVSLTIVVDYGSPIPEVAGNIQENVKKAIETMSGLTVAAVNVHVSAVSFEKEQRATAEIEEKQRLMLQQRETADAEADKAEDKPEEKADDKPAGKGGRRRARRKAEKADKPADEAQAAAPAAEPEPAAEPAPEEDEDAFELDLGDEPDEPNVTEPAETPETDGDEPHEAADQ